VRTDFGKGFYFTDKIDTTKGWAINRTEVRGTGMPTILRYTLDFEGLEAALVGMRFSAEPSPEWLDFIGLNRERRPKNEQGKEPKHDYHWVSGPIADDSMNDVVEEYLAGEISADEAIRRAKTLPRTFQLSLHTQDALYFVDDVNVQYRQLKIGRWSPQAPNWSKRK
jgi:hypothetical protein